MSRPVSHPATGRRFDLAAAAPDDIEFLRGLRDNLPSREHGLICETAGGSDEDKQMYAYRAGDGDWWCRHFPGHAHGGGHRVEPESDAHKRGKEYAIGAYDRGGIQHGTEIGSDNGTRSDVIGFGAVVTAAEIQASPKDARVIKARDTRARRATAITTPGYARPLTTGIQPVWAQIHDGAADWLHQVPSVRASIRYGIWTEQMPRPGTVGAAGIRTIDPEPCRPGSRWDHCPHLGGGFCGGWHGYASVRTGLALDDVFIQAATGLLVPIRYHTGHLYLTDPASVDVYAELGGDGTWTPGRPQAAYRHIVGPCRYRAHTVQDEQERLAREQAERRQAEAERLERERAEREQLLGDGCWQMFRQARRRREQRERGQCFVTPRASFARSGSGNPHPAGQCTCPGCPSPARQWPGGWWCSKHPCRGCRACPAGSTKNVRGL